MGNDPAGVDAGWVLAAFDHSSDLLLAMAADTTIRWASPACRRMGGYEPSELVGRSMADFVHPDDLERAAEVMALADADRFNDAAPITPALYRIRHADGSWVPLEINASRASTGDDLLVVIRQSGDQVLTDRLQELIIAGAPLHDQLALILELGRWRYPTEGYAVICCEDDGTRFVGSVGIADGRLAAREAVAEPAPWNVAMASGQRVSVTDPDWPDAVSLELADLARAEGFDAVLAVPVPDPAHAEGACLVVWSTPTGPSVAGQRYPMANMARALALSLQSRAQRLDLERAANVDVLTGLATRQRFFEVAPRWIDEGAGAVLYVDLDGFKEVNDVHGHSAGDYVLATTASRLAHAIGPDALVGRLGGDEFAVLCPPHTSAEAAGRLAQAIIDAAREPVGLAAGPVVIGASVGIALRTGDEILDDILERADRALLATKAAGKSSWRLA